MPISTAVALSIPCEMCGGRPFLVTVPMRTEPVDGWPRVVIELRVVIDDDYLRSAVRAHLRQHQN